MARGAIASQGSSGENIQHFSTIRIRATGNGSLKIRVRSLDNVRAKILVPVPLQAVNRIQPNRIVNFNEQRASFEITTLEMNEYYRLNRIIIYTKEIFTSYPGA